MARLNQILRGKVRGLNPSKGESLKAPQREVYEAGKEGYDKNTQLRPFHFSGLVPPTVIPNLLNPKKTGQERFDTQKVTY